MPSFLFLFMPVVVAVHNMEELSRRDQFVAVYYPRVPFGWVTADSLRIAAIVSTSAVAVVSFQAYWHGAFFWLQIEQVTMAGFAINAIGHCILSLRKRSMLPGTWTALFLMLPFAVIGLLRSGFLRGQSVLSLASIAGLGLVAGPPVILVCLVLGYASQMISKMVYRRFSQAASVVRTTL